MVEPHFCGSTQDPLTPVPSLLVRRPGTTHTRPSNQKSCSASVRSLSTTSPPSFNSQDEMEVNPLLPLVHRWTGVSRRVQDYPQVTLRGLVTLRESEPPYDFWTKSFSPLFRVESSFPHANQPSSTRSLPESFRSHRRFLSVGDERAPVSGVLRGSWRRFSTCWPRHLYYLGDKVAVWACGVEEDGPGNVVRPVRVELNSSLALYCTFEYALRLTRLSSDFPNCISPTSKTFHCSLWIYTPNKSE